MERGKKGREKGGKMKGVRGINEGRKEEKMKGEWGKNEGIKGNFKCDVLRFLFHYSCPHSDDAVDNSLVLLSSAKL